MVENDHFAALDDIQHAPVPVTDADTERREPADDDAKDIEPIDPLLFEDTLTDKVALKNLWFNLLANDQDSLRKLYPDAKGHIADGFLHGLNSAKWNQHPVAIKKRVEGTNRYVVIPIDYDKKHSPLKIKMDNILAINTSPASKALEQFKFHMEPDVWATLTDDNTFFGDIELIQSFLELQFPRFNMDSGQFEFAHLQRLKGGYKRLITDTLREAQSQHLTLTQVGCATIISFLYSLAFVRKLHVIRSFSVSPDWAIRKWPGDIDLYLPMPP